MAAVWPQLVVVKPDNCHHLYMEWKKSLFAHWRGYMEWKKSFLAYWRGYIDFKGSASRSDFWTATGIVSLIGLVLFALVAFLGVMGAAIFSLWAVATVVPTFAILTRRLRDAGYSLYWLFVMILGPLGLAVLLILAARKKNEKTFLRLKQTLQNPKPTALAGKSALSARSTDRKQSGANRPSKDERTERNQRNRERKAEAARQHLEKYGKPIASEVFGWTLIEIFKTGHVRIARGEMQELLGIEFTDISQRKNQIGRMAGFIGTGGLNMFTSTRKGEAFLSISTASGSKTLKVGEVRPSDIETAHKLMAASKTVIHGNRSQSSGNETAPDLSAQLEKLSSMKNSGELSEGEFAAAKKKLLG